MLGTEDNFWVRLYTGLYTYSLLIGSCSVQKILFWLDACSACFYTEDIVLIECLYNLFGIFF